MVWLLAVASAAIVSGAGADTRLLEAVKAGNRQTVRTLLNQHADANVREVDGTTALHWAARNDDAETAIALIRAGATANVANRYGVTPLFLAATNGNAALVETLLKSGADANAVLPEGQTVVMAAARTGAPAVVKALLASGADTNVHDGRLGETALMWAAAENHADAIDLLIEHGADVNARSNPADFPRFSFGDGIVALMMTLPRGHWTPMMYAARQGALNATRSLAKGKANLDLQDPEGTTALMLALNNAHYDVAALLVDQGADPNVADVTGMTSLYAAVNMKYPGRSAGSPAPRPRQPNAEWQALLVHGADPNPRLLKPILMRHHSGGDGALGEGATPLLRAAKTGDVAMIRLLLDRRADPTLTTRNQTTAVMLAAGPAGGGLGGSFPVTDAEKIAAITLLLDRGVDINAVDGTGQSALHVAAGQAGASIVTALVQRGAKLDLEDRQGRTPLDVAMGIGGRGAPVPRTEIVDLLRRFAGQVAAAPAR